MKARRIKTSNTHDTVTRTDVMKSEHVTLIGRDIGLTGSAEDSGLPVFLLRVMTGPDKGRMLALDWTRTSRVLVGTGPRADLALTDPRVSRRHVSLSPEGARLRLRDLGSRNGTTVNGLVVAEAWLSGGETIALGETTLRVSNTGAHAEIAARTEHHFGRVLGRSAAMQRLFAWGERAAMSHEPLVIEGEPGTGKDLFAEAIHDAGARSGVGSERPFVLVATETLRMSGVPQLLADARGGTLLVSDPEELPLAVQESLAAAIALNGSRVIATTRRDLDRECDSGRLTAALFLALSGDVVHMPPLRQRHGDVELLASHFFAQGGAKGAPTDALLAGFLDYEWPGNVRELRDAIDRIIIGDADRSPAEAAPLTSGDRVTGTVPRDLIGDILSRNPTLSQARAELTGELEQRFVREALAKHHGNVTRAAAASGITRRYFHLLRKKR